MANLLQNPDHLVALRNVALAGNPNAGKTTLFNALTGMRQKVGNYPGVTVEKKEGRCRLESGGDIVVLDLPGTYSLSPKSPDEEIARDVLLGLRHDVEIPDAVIVVVDASNLERNLYLATQVLELGLPTIVALNMTDVAEVAGKTVDAARLSNELGAPVVETVAVRGRGLKSLRAALAEAIARPQSTLPKMAPATETVLATLADELGTQLGAGSPLSMPGLALRLLCGNLAEPALAEHMGTGVAAALQSARTRANQTPGALAAAEATARYEMLGIIVDRVVEHPHGELSRSFSDKADSVLTHKVFGLIIFALITLLVFQAIFSWAQYPMDLINLWVSAGGNFVANHMAAGPLRDLLVSGVIAGVGSVVVFLPQIMVLFFFIGLLEDTGYMARAAFLMDRLMARVGLHGRSFIPLLSSFACAIPGIMATRTIASRRDRMTTILIAPFMTCSARLPVYALMMTTFIPNQKVGGVVSLRAAVLFGLYGGGVAAAMAAAWVFKKTLFRGPAPALMLELPPYKIPALRNILTTMWDRGSQFLKRAGTVILAISILLWFLLSYPKLSPSQVAQAEAAQTASLRQPLPVQTALLPVAAGASALSAAAADKIALEDRITGLQTEYSFGGRIGHVIEPLIAPLGFNWRIGIGLLGAMSAREVFVSTMGTVYSVGSADEKSTPLQSAMRRDHWPDGRPVWTTLVAVSLLIYFVLAMQCISTLAVVRRETNSWTWPLFMQVYMTGLAWLASFLVYQVGGRLF